ncbi:MAG: hypothetical protein KAS70_06170 [Planctomycetes bacterium]|nr:hypothetical protein [Planctomycetota bacterium]
MKLITVVEAHHSLVAIQNANDLPIALAWQILDHVAEMAPSATRFDEQRKILAEKYGDVDPKNPDLVQIRKKEEAKFKKEFEELTEIDIKLNGLPKLKKADILESGMKVPAGTNIGALRPFIEGEKSD